MGAKSTLFKSLAKAASYPVLHPVDATKQVAKAGIGVMAAGYAGHLAWENMAHDQSVVRTVGKDVLGEKAVDKMSAAGEKVASVADSVKDGATALQSNLSDIGQSVAGTASGLTGTGGFMQNLLKGNVSTLGVAALVASAFMLFGRHGILGKLAGLALGAMVLSNGLNIFQRSSDAGLRASENYDRQQEAFDNNVIRMSR